MYCPYCKHIISVKTNFCEQCGKKLPACPTCGHIIRKKEKCCPVDGTPLSPAFFADWSLEKVPVSNENTGLEDDLQKPSCSEAEASELDTADSEHHDEEFDEDYEDLEAFDDYDEAEEFEKSNWKPVFIAAAIIGVICVFVSYIAMVTGPGTLKTEKNIHVEAPAKQAAPQEADANIFCNIPSAYF